MDKIVKEYRKINGQDYKMEVYYNIGNDGYRPVKRGYYVLIVPVQIQEYENGVICEVTSAYSGAKRLLLEVKRKSKKSEKIALGEFDKVKSTMLDYVVTMNEAA